LQALSDALGGSLPFKAAAMDIGYISLSLGWSDGEFMASWQIAKVMCSSFDVLGD